MKTLPVLALALAAGLSVFAAPAAWERDSSFAPTLVNEASAALGVTLAPMSDGRLLVHGNLTHLGSHATAGLGRLRADGAADPTFTVASIPNEYILAAAPLPDGRALVLRRTYSLGYAVENLVRLNADGTIDPTYAALPFRGSLSLTALPDGRVLASGHFNAIGDARRENLARFNADGTLDANFVPQLPEAPFYLAAAAADSAGNVYVSGSSWAQRQGARHFFRLAPDGSVDPEFKPEYALNFTVLAVQPDGKLLASTPPPLIMTLLPQNEMVYGEFVRFLPDGSVDPGFSRRFSGDVRRIEALPDGRIGVHALIVSRPPLQPDSPAFAPVPPPSIHHSTVLILSRDGAVERDLRSSVGPDNDVELLGTDANGDVLVRYGPPVGDRSDLAVPVVTGPGMEVWPTMPVPHGSLARGTLARVSPATGEVRVVSAPPLHRQSGSVSRIRTDGAGRILVTGAFTSIDGEPRPGIARFLAGGALDPSFAPAPRANASDPHLQIVHPDGRAIVFESSLEPADSDGFHRPSVRFLRFLANGEIDPTFAPGADLLAHLTRWHAATADGRVLVSYFSPDNSHEGNLKLGWMRADGTLEPPLPVEFRGLDHLAVTYGGGADAPGSIVRPAGTYANSLNVALQPDGRLLVHGIFSHVSGEPRHQLVRLLSDGSIDRDFVADTSRIRWLESVTRLADGRLMIAGRSNATGRELTLARRLLPDGARDPGFPDLLLPGFSAFVWTDDGLPDLNYPTRRVEPWGGILTPPGVIAGDGSLWVGLERYVPRELIGITVQPESQTIVAGRVAYLQVAIGTTNAAAYEWLHDGAPIAGATGALLRFPCVRPSDAGTYQVRVTIDGQVFTSEPAILTVTPSTARLINFSGRSRVSADAPQIIGIVTRSPTPRPIFLRAVGRGLRRLGVNTPLGDPTLTLHEHTGGGTRIIAADRGHGDSPDAADTAVRVGAFPLLPDSVDILAHHPLGSAVLPSLRTGAFTAVTTADEGDAGIALGEFYDVESADESAWLRNASLRGYTGPGEDVLTMGFVIAGNGPLQLLLRGIGPTLADQGVTNPIADPRLTVIDARDFQPPLLTNDDWSADPEIAAAARHVGAFALPPDSRDAALLITLEPGVYTIQLAGAGESSGQALAEIYVVGP